MRGRSYTPSPPPRGYGRRSRSPSPRGRYGGGRDSDLSTSLMVRNLPYDCRKEDLRRRFAQFGSLKDIHLPRDYYTGDLRGFGFIDYEDPADAAEAKDHMDGSILLGRELTVAFAEEKRKTPTEMRKRDRGGRSNRFHYRRRSPARYSRSPPRRRGRRSRSRSRSYNSPPPKRYQSRSDSPQDRRYGKERSYSRSPSHNGSRVHSGSPGIASRSPRRRVSPRRNRSYMPEQAKSHSPVPRKSRSPTPSPRGAGNGDRSPSQ